jgi:hypothetical protein
MPHFIFFYTSLAVAKVAYEFVQKFFIIWIPQDINAIKSNRICKRRIAFPPNDPHCLLKSRIDKVPSSPRLLGNLRLGTGVSQ